MFTTLLVLLTSLCAYGQPGSFTPLDNPAAFQKALKATARQTQTIQSDFTQEKHLSVLSEKIVTKGKFYFKKENLLRWEYKIPFEYVIVLDGNQVMIRDEEEVRAYDLQSNKIFQELNNLMIELVQGSILESGGYAFEFLENDNQYLVQLTPKQPAMGEYLEAIHLYVSRNDYSVERLQLLEPGGDYTDIVFSNKKRNTPIADEKFALH